MFNELTARQARTAHKALRHAISIADHVQARRSPIDGWAAVDVFVGRTCHSVTIGPRGRLVSQESQKVE